VQHGGAGVVAVDGFLDLFIQGPTMQFLDDYLLPENQQPLVIQVAPYGPEFLPGDSDDIPVTMDEQI